MTKTVSKTVHFTVDAAWAEWYALVAYLTSPLYRDKYADMFPQSDN